MSENQVVETVKEEVKAEETRGSRGDVGTASIELQMKQKWHATHFKRIDAEDRRNNNKKTWAKNPGPRVSLKRFARELAYKGDQLAKTWLALKKGSMNPSRSKEKLARIALERQASKTARKKVKAGGKPATTTAK